MLTTEALVAEIPEEKKGAPAGGGHGGGMGDVYLDGACFGARKAGHLRRRFAVAVAPSVASLLQARWSKSPWSALLFLTLGSAMGLIGWHIASGESVSHVTDIGLPREEIITEESLRRML